MLHESSNLFSLRKPPLAKVLASALVANLVHPGADAICFGYRSGASNGVAEDGKT
ncbi:MAG: hypothetical protein JWO08_578 [Verrucomicrobiaceae bacterium]|nr:hypothetical protein [Verrucomicrobiaceae bacterium]